MTQDSPWVSTGDKQLIPQGWDKLPDFEPATGDHLWSIGTLYRWGGPHVEQPTLDAENLLAISSPGCYFCEQMYTERLAGQRCPGQPLR